MDPNTTSRSSQTPRAYDSARGDLLLLLWVITPTGLTHLTGLPMLLFAALPAFLLATAAVRALVVWARESCPEDLRTFQSRLELLFLVVAQTYVWDQIIVPVGFVFGEMYDGVRFAVVLPVTHGASVSALAALACTGLLVLLHGALIRVRSSRHALAVALAARQLNDPERSNAAPVNGDVVAAGHSRSSPSPPLPTSRSRTCSGLSGPGVGPS